MSGYRDKLKSLRPEKDGNGVRGQIKNLMGRGDDTDYHKVNHVARPLSSLRDPSSFAPPPKHVATGNAGALQPRAHPSQRSSPGTNQGPYAAVPALETYGGTAYSAEEDAPPPKPYRVDTTGLSTANLPAPPLRRDGADGRTPTPLGSASSTAVARPGPPNLPPRLPARSNNGSPVGKTAPALPARTSTPESQNRSNLLNQGAVNRLGAAGISVPGLGIGSGPSAPQHSTPSPPTTSPASGNPQLNELQSRFAKLGTPSSPTTKPPPTEGTTFAQKQAAFRTASALRQDPSSVSLSDARGAASTINNFRQRHGEQAAAGWQGAKDANEKHGILDKVGGYAPKAKGDQASGSPVSTAAGLLAKSKPAPPPPPKKKPDLAGHSVTANSNADAPPPIPMGTRPQF